MLTAIIVEAVRSAIARQIPFVAYVKPHCDEVCFFSDPSDAMPLLSDRCFIVNSWCGCPADEFAIAERADAAMTIRLCAGLSSQACTCPQPWTEPTARQDYGRCLDIVIEHLQDHGGKVVISRTITGDATDVEWVVVADRYFGLHPEAFRYIYFTPRHGFWLGASPELLLSVDEGKFRTMALAGTREVCEKDKPWSGKNIAEQAVVRNYIVDRLYDLGLDPQCGPTVTVETGNIQHLCTCISGDAETCTSVEILRSLNPTPALAGYPLSSALEQIVRTEKHPRRCYGGYVAVAGGKSFSAYVNLRCVNFDDMRWCMYVGGGIMPGSDIDDEWHETEAKSLILKKLIEDSLK